MDSRKSIRFGDELIAYTLVRRRRKTVGITVSLAEGVRVLAPAWVSDRQLADILGKKAAWIYKKLQGLKMASIESPEKEFTDGELFMYLGREYALKVCEYSRGHKPGTYFDGNNFVVNTPANLGGEKRREYVKEQLQRWYVKAAGVLFADRIAFFAGRMGVKPCRISVRNQKTRWGSCSSKGNINLNWRIIMAPLEVVDYIIVHELSHMLQMNHSKNFWSIVQNILPDFNERRRWLKQNGKNLRL